MKPKLKHFSENKKAKTNAEGHLASKELRILDPIGDFYSRFISYRRLNILH